MCHTTRILLLSYALLGYAALLTQAVPLSLLSVDDDDDTVVIELPTNAIDEPPPPAASTTTRDMIDLSSLGSAMFGQPDLVKTAARVANYSMDAYNVNPEELGTYLEGDILVPQASGLIMKNGVTTHSARWPKAIVPYEIRGSFSARDRATIESAIEQYHKRTCIRFVQRSSERDYVSIVSGNSGCWSSVGRVGGKQEVNLQSPGCLTRHGTAIHELMHALGFLHEQNRMERDDYVSIQYQNIQTAAVNNFDKAQRTEAYGVPYDYGSVMHYSENAFSVNGRPTILAVQAGGKSQMGQRNGFSDYDVQKLNKMYDCDANAGVPAPFPGLPAPMPGLPAPMPGVPALPAAGGNPIIDSFLGGLINGLTG